MSKQTITDYLKYKSENPQDFVGGEIEIITDKQTLIDYEKYHECTLGIVYRSKYHILAVDLVKGNDGIYAYERIIKTSRGNAVVIIPLYNEKFVLLRQFRHSLRSYQLCFPRGFGETDISIEDNAKKEIMEELKCKTITCNVIGTVVADSGLCGEKVSVCLCEIEKPRLNFGYEGISGVELFDLQELTETIKKGEINDGFTLSAVSLYLAKFSESFGKSKL